LHPVELNAAKKNEETSSRSGKDNAVEENSQQPKNGKGGDQVIAATGAGDSRVCLGVLPVKVRAKNGNSHVETYALLDSGSEVTLCHEELTERLHCHGKKRNFTLTGMTGSQQVESQLVDIVVESMDGTTAVELENVGRSGIYQYRKIVFQRERIWTDGHISKGLTFAKPRTTKLC
jgi:hypothetical protein